MELEIQSSPNDDRSDDEDPLELKADQDNVIFWNKIYLVTKIFFSGLLFILVLSSAVVSKGALVLLTWNIFTPYNTTQSALKTLGGHFHFTKNRTEEQEFPEDLTETNLHYVWALFLLAVAPNVLSMLVSLWKFLTKKSDALKWIPLLIALVTAILHSIGVSIIVFSLLPSLDPISGPLYSTTITFIPTLVDIIFSDKKFMIKHDDASRVAWPLIGRILAFVLSISSLVFWCLYASFASSSAISDAQLMLFILAPMLVSFEWWENFVPPNKNTALSNNSVDVEGHGQDTTKNCIERFLDHVYVLQDPTYTGRHKINLIVYTCKAVILFLMMLSIHGPHVFDLFLDKQELMVEHNSEGFGSTRFSSGDSCDRTTPFLIAIVGIIASLVCRRLSLAAIKIVAQIESFYIPVMLATPVTALTVFAVSDQLQDGDMVCNFPFPWWENDGSIPYLSCMIVASVTGFLSFLLLTTYIWTNNIERMMKGHEIYLMSLYCGTFFDQSLLLNRRKHLQGNTPIDLPESEQSGTTSTSVGRNDSLPLIYLCATMWHESETEMINLLKSLYRMDKDQKDLFELPAHPDKYKFEAHIFFDDAFSKNCSNSCANTYVRTFVSAMESTSKNFNTNRVETQFTKIVTPYGGQLVWDLPNKNKLIAHLKDETKIRKKKRWSQVMYMYYFLSHKLGVDEIDFAKKSYKAKNIYILALDGDVDFRPAAVKLLVDRMKRNEEVGAACGRIHPIGEGAMVWYQKFEYAVSHWLVKATEHVTGCVLCSPGCFSLFRGSSLMNENVLKTYTTRSSEARHHIQYDQGEDRWLCTLLLKEGYKVDYCAASDAFTFAPEDFKVFYNQRRRWTPSTMANIMDLLSDWKIVMKRNNYITFPYIALQSFWFLSSLVTPGVLLLMIVGSINLAYPGMSLVTAMIVNLVPIAVFVLLCFFAKTEYQLNFAAALSIVYSLVMMVVLIGLIKQSVDQGFCSLTTPFFLGVCGIFVITGIMHPQEMSCLFHGLLFFIAIPSMSILLMIYSIVNMNNVSWGTREAPKSVTDQEEVTFFQNIVKTFSRSSKQDSQPNEDVERPNEEEAGGITCICRREGDQLSFNVNGLNPLCDKEITFWKWLINEYLHPSGNSSKMQGASSLASQAANKRLQREEDNRKKEDLKLLRNKASLAFFLINGIFTTIIFFLQQINEDDSGHLSIQLTCSDGGSLRLEPMSMTFTLVFGILLTIQFISMLVHRFKTFLQINSITRVVHNCVSVTVEKRSTSEQTEQEENTSGTHWTNQDQSVTSPQEQTEQEENTSDANSADQNRPRMNINVESAMSATSAATEDDKQNGKRKKKKISRRNTSSQIVAEGLPQMQQNRNFRRNTAIHEETSNETDESNNSNTLNNSRPVRLPPLPPPFTTVPNRAENIETFGQFPRSMSPASLSTRSDEVINHLNISPMDT